MSLRPQSPESLALCAAAIPDLVVRMGPYRVADQSPDAELFACFLDCLGQAIAALQQAGATGDLTAVARQAHSIKGMGGAAGAAEISVVGEQLERSAKAGETAPVLELIAILTRWHRDVLAGEGSAS